jgi:hypothetical protein
VISGDVDAGQSVIFVESASLGSLTYTSYAWTGLPAGCAGTEASVTCSGSELPAGSYSIAVTVTDSNGFSSPSSAPLAFVVDPDPTVTATSSPPGSADLGQTVEFSASASSGSGAYSFAWSGLPGGCGGSLAVLLCRPIAVGVYDVQVAVTDSNSFTIRNSPIAFSVFSDPTTNLTSNPVEGVDLGHAVTLRANAALGSGDYSYNWTGLPSGCSGDAANMTCTPTQAGSFRPTVIATDSNGMATRPGQITLVVAVPLVIEVSTYPPSPAPGQVIELTANATGGTSPATFAWVFGDGSTSSGAIVNHSFGKPGRFEVSVWVNDSGGGSMRSNLNLTVSAPTGGLGDAFWPLVGVVVAVIAVAVTVVFLKRRRRATKGESGTADGVAAADEPAESPQEQVDSPELATRG